MTSCTAQKALPHYSPAEQQAQRESISYWQPAPAQPDTAHGFRAEPGSQADLIRSIFDGHPPVVQMEVEAEPDSLHFVKVPRPASWLGKLFGRTPKPYTVATTQARIGKCKKCPITINVVQGNQTNTSTSTSTAKNGRTVVGDGASNTETGKKSGTVIKADSGATVYNAETKKGPAAAGEGIAQVPPAAGFSWWWVVVACAGCYLGYKKFIA
jgi:hypothetical protein